MIRIDGLSPRKAYGAACARARAGKLTAVFSSSACSTIDHLQSTSAHGRVAKRAAFTSVLALIAAACTGNIDGIDSPRSNAERGDSRDEFASGPAAGQIAARANPLTCEARAVGETPMRRLTHTEYDNALRDLLGVATHPGAAFAADTQGDIFDNGVTAQVVPTLLAEQYVEAAVSAAENISNPDALVGCSLASSPAAACIEGFVARFGRRAYRRPLSQEELVSLVALYDRARSMDSPVVAVRAVVAAVLTSPHFLFRPEFGAADATLPHARRLTSFELAGRLASLLWASLPDDALLDAAAQGRLESHDDVEREARRMLADERAQAAVASFYDQWFGLKRLETASKEPAVYPEFDEALRASMLGETRRFVSHVLWQDDARLATLLTGSFSYVNGTMATFYGLAQSSEPDEYVRVELDPAERAGVLTQPSILSAYASTDQSSPVKRGNWVRTRLLCTELPAPPATPDLPAQVSGTTNRERFAAHTSTPACQSCHRSIDGLGFGLESYDGIGRFRTNDHGVPVNSDGVVDATRDIDGAYRGGPELAARLARSEQVQDCAVTQWFRYASGREEGEDDACSLVSLQQKFAASRGDLRELLVELTLTDAFWHYRAVE